MRFASILLLLLVGASEPQTPSASPLPGQVVTPSKTADTPKSLPAAVPSQPVEWQALAVPARTTAIIVGPRESSPGDLVILDASTSDAASFAWALPGSTKTLLPVDGGKRCVFATGAQGRYVFVLATAKGDAVAIATHELVIGKPEPPVPPPIPPGPPTPPTPTTDKVWAIVIHDASAATAETARIVGDMTLWKQIRDAGHKTLTLDNDDPVVVKNNYQPAVTEAGGLPILLLLDMKGARIKSMKLPATRDEVLAAIKGATGK